MDRSLATTVHVKLLYVSALRERYIPTPLSCYVAILVWEKKSRVEG